MDVRSYVQAVRKGWWLVALATILGVVIGVALNLTATKLYASRVTFYVSTPASTDAGALSADQFAQRRTNSYVELLSSERLAEAVRASTRLDLSTAHLMNAIHGSAQVNTVLLVATVKDTNTTRAATIARAVASDFPRMIDGLDNDGAKKTPTVRLNVVSGPTTSSTPVAPRQLLNLTVYGLLGLLVGLALAIIRELADTTMRTPEALRERTNVPVIGSILLDADARNSPVLVTSQLHSTRAEEFRQLRTNLQFVDIGGPVKVILVTSSVAGEGKSATAINLGIVFAEAGRRVLIIEADLRRPSIGTYMDADSAFGLTNVLAGEVSFDHAVQSWGADALDVLTAGSIPPNPSELLGSQSMRLLVADLRSKYDLIIVDTPPLLPVTDAAVAAALSDGVVLVVRSGKTSRTQLASSVRSLDNIDARVLGSVLNMRRRTRKDDRNSYEGYHTYLADNPDLPLGPSLIVAPDDAEQKASTLPVD